MVVVVVAVVVVVVVVAIVVVVVVVAAVVIAVAVAGNGRRQSSNSTHELRGHSGMEGSSRLSTTAYNVENKKLMPYMLNDERKYNARQ